MQQGRRRTQSRSTINWSVEKGRKKKLFTAVCRRGRGERHHPLGVSHNIPPRGGALLQKAISPEAESIINQEKMTTCTLREKGHFKTKGRKGVKINGTRAPTDREKKKREGRHGGGIEKGKFLPRERTTFVGKKKTEKRSGRAFAGC